MESPKITIGRNVHVDLIGHAQQVSAKVDTGADSSSVWASNVTITADGTLQFTLFDIGSPFYDGKVIETTNYTVATVRSATGHEEIRYRTTLAVRVKGKRIKAVFNLSNRSRNRFPVLIGRRTLSNKFIVDVTMADEESRLVFENENKKLNHELNENPHAFYEKYHGKDL
ncbi:MAG: RimK/LysX family protein [Patescibacteria group bacterium]